MSDNTWGEIFNLNEELKKIEEEVDRRLEETLAEDPHVIEQETVHYGSPENYRMRQSLPVFANAGDAAPEPVEEETIPAPDPVEEEAPLVEEPAAETATVIAFPGAAEEPATVEETPESAEPAAEEPVVVETPVEEAIVEEVPAEEQPAEEPPAEEQAAVEPPVEEPIVEEAPAEEQPAEEQPAAVAMPAAAHEEPVRQTPVTETPVVDNRRKVLVVLIAAVVALAAILGGLYVNSQQKPKAQYEAAQALLNADDYDGAIEAFTATHGYKDSAARILEAQYAKASALVSAGSYNEAVDYIDSLSEPSDAMRNLRASAIYQSAVQDYADGALDVAVRELEQIRDYETDGISAANLLNQIRYQQASDALAIYDFDAAEPILEALGDYEDAPILLQQVQNAVDIVYTDVARDDDGVEIPGKTEYLWVHSVIRPGVIPADATENKVLTELRGLACATDEIDDDAVKVLMMHQATTDAEMLYIDADPIKTDKSDVITMDISQYAGIDETFGEDQILYAPQTLQRSNTDFTFAFEGSEAYAGKAADKSDKDADEDDTDTSTRVSDEVRMECKMADDGYWVKTRRVYDQMENGKLVGVPQHQLRTWTKVTTESVADEVRNAFRNHMSE